MNWLNVLMFKIVDQDNNKKPNPKLGIILGLIFGLIGSFIWAACAVLSGYYIFVIASIISCFVTCGFFIAGRDTNAKYGVYAAGINTLCLLFSQVLVSIFSLSYIYDTSLLTLISSIDYIKLINIILADMDMKIGTVYIASAIFVYKMSYINDKGELSNNENKKDNEDNIEDNRKKSKREPNPFFKFWFITNILRLFITQYNTIQYITI